MSSNRKATLILLPVLAMLVGCETAYPGPPASVFGEANRQTMMAQVVDPYPYYEELNPPTSAEHAAQAAERYRADAVKQPEQVSTSSGPQ